MPDPETLEGIAIVGMSGRFPGARDLEEYWRNLRDGVEAISRFSAEELAAAGIPREILEAPDYVRAGGVIEGVEMFDAQLFGFTAREAELLDPHHRLFLEQAWQALEHAGYDSSRYPGAIGVFGGMGMGEYLLKNLHSNPEVLRAAGG
ncbi:MAG TPA: beta-ketoacyl synthase N-terminal-like domain-containing protein, partial [Thermoanaerobaculia bacterium]|nr:beta-ketoacyl synthase N-terminal-like domain-containing protein [Thermoanaerobaculia bacterium]